MRGLLFTHFLFKDIFAEWLEYRRGDLKESSLIKYRNIVKTYLLPRFADKDIRTLSYEKVKGYIEELRQSGGKQHKGLSAATLRTIVTVIKSIFCYASNTKRLKVAGLSDLKADCRQKEIRVLTTTEQISLEEKCREKLTHKDAGIILMLFTGIRIGELCALKWGDIDLESSVMNISRTLQRIQTEGEAAKTKIVETAPKSQKSIRQVPITSNVMPVLEKIKGQPEEYLLSGKSKATEPRTMQRYIKSLTEKLSMKNVTCHTLRHSFATRCVEYRVDTKSLSEVLGHSSVQITMDRYVHPSMEMKRKSIDLMVKGMHRKEKVVE